MIKIDIKPLSVNEAWQGYRRKTKKYLKFESDALTLLPNIIIPPPPYVVALEFGFSSKLSDLDNPIKLILDILQKKYEFNDRYIIELHVKKVAVSKGNEYIRFEFLK